ncbi:MAG: thioredoxin family protein [Gemmatimonadota bacterium]
MPSLLSRRPDIDTDWAVVCLCAAWCRTCDAYRPDLASLAEKERGVRFVWLDVEDDADWVGELDIETFPTLLVLARETPLFFGALPPQIGVFERTLAALRGGEARAAALEADAAAAAREIAERLQRWRA